MIAVDNIGEGEVLFQIPRNMLLHPGTTAIQTLLEEGKARIFLLVDLWEFFFRFRVWGWEGRNKKA